MIRKDMIIAILITFLLTAILFRTLPTNSDLRDYDPWYDVTGPTPGQPDGKIDVRDVYALEMKYGTTGTGDQTTRNVSVTNWPWSPPKPTTVYCGTWILRWDRTGLIDFSVVDNPNIDVQGYEKMTITIRSTEIHVIQSYVRVMPIARWLDSSLVYCHEDLLTSTLYHIISYENGNLQAEQISSDSYPIKAPYVNFWPRFDFDSRSLIGSGGNATFSIYAYLSNGAAASSLHKTMSWIELVQSNSSYYNYAQFDLQGFCQLTIQLCSNVTWGYVEVVKIVGAGNTKLVDSFSLTSGDIIKTYALDCQNYYIHLNSPSATPWYLYGSFYVVS